MPHEEKGPPAPENRLWIEKTLAHEETGAVPYNFIFCPPARRLAEQHYGTRDLENRLDFPSRMNSPLKKRPLYATPEEYGETTTDEFGVVWANSQIDRGAPIGHPLAQADLSSYEFPDPSEEYRFEPLAEWCAETEGHFRTIWVGDLWERATFMRGMEPLLLDVALNPGFVGDLLQRLADYIMATMRILFERFDFECIAVSDDYGSQNGLLMSPADWRKLIKPRLSQVYSLARANGRRVFHHTCGDVHPVIADMIEIGLDILHPIQPEAMDIHRLKREFGKDLTFCGGINTQNLLPRGTPEEVRAEIRNLKDQMGKGGGYILEPGITVNADVPLENLIAMLEEANARP